VEALRTRVAQFVRGAPAHDARQVDGASEVHKGVLARYLIEERGAFWHWDQTP